MYREFQKLKSTFILYGRLLQVLLAPGVLMQFNSHDKSDHCLNINLLYQRMFIPFYRLILFKQRYQNLIHHKHSMHDVNM